MRRAFYVAAVTVMALATGAAPGIATATTAPPVPATEVHIGGSRVTVDCTGTGGPTVILFSGFGDPHTIWAHIQRSLSRHHRVCSYDRLGEGTSSQPRRTQTLASNARLLHRVLAKVHVHGPLVLVGHSIGGGNATGYAPTHPQTNARLGFFVGTPARYLPFLLPLIPPPPQSLP